jgi:hypothetical protein
MICVHTQYINATEIHYNKNNSKNTNIINIYVNKIKLYTDNHLGAVVGQTWSLCPAKGPT